MKGYETYLNYLAQTPNEFYRDNVQAFVSQEFTDTTRLDTIYEENIPFDFTFNDGCEVIVDTVSENFINLNKVLGDYLSIKFEDCKHKNSRGQYIKYDNDYYLVYEEQDKLDTMSNCKIIRCNNKIKWYDENGVLREYPVFIGNEVGSTNPQVSKDGITNNVRLVLMLQGNEHTRNIFVNQRFIISHHQVFKINEIGQYELSNYENENVDMIKLYIEWTTLNSNDDLDNNISYNGDVYEVKISETSINQISGFEGKLNVITTINNIVDTDIPISYSSSDLSVVEIDSNGNYRLVGNSGSRAIIKAYITDNENVYDEIEVKIVEDATINDEIVITPLYDKVEQYNTIIFTANLYEDNVMSSNIVECTASGVDGGCYSLKDTINHNEFTLQCFEPSDTPLQLTFTSGIVTKTINVDLIQFR